MSSKKGAQAAEISTSGQCHWSCVQRPADSRTSLCQETTASVHVNANQRGATTHQRPMPADVVYSEVARHAANVPLSEFSGRVSKGTAHRSHPL